MYLYHTHIFLLPHPVCKRADLQGGVFFVTLPLMAQTRITAAAIEKKVIIERSGYVVLIWTLAKV